MKPSSRCSGLSFTAPLPLIAATLSDFQHQPFGVLDALLDPDQEADGLAAVDDAVVVGEGQVHHRPDDDLVVDGDRPLLDRVHAEDAALRRVEDRRREQRAEDAAVGDRERAALEVVDGDRALAGLVGERGDRLLDLGEASAGRRRGAPGPSGPRSVLTATPMS